MSKEMKDKELEKVTGAGAAKPGYGVVREKPLEGTITGGAGGNLDVEGLDEEYQNPDEINVEHD